MPFPVTNWLQSDLISTHLRGAGQQCPWAVPVITHIYNSWKAARKCPLTGPVATKGSVNGGGYKSIADNNNMTTIQQISDPQGPISSTKRRVVVGHRTRHHYHQSQYEELFIGRPNRSWPEGILILFGLPGGCTGGNGKVLSLRHCVITEGYRN